MKIKMAQGAVLTIEACQSDLGKGPMAKGVDLSEAPESLGAGWLF